MRKTTLTLTSIYRTIERKTPNIYIVTYIYIDEHTDTLTFITPIRPALAASCFLIPFCMPLAVLIVLLERFRCAYEHTHTRTHMNTHTYEHTHMRTDTQMNTHTHNDTHRETHTYIETY